MPCHIIISRALPDVHVAPPGLRTVLLRDRMQALCCHLLFDKIVSVQQPSAFGQQPAAASTFGSPFGQSSASLFGAPSRIVDIRLMSGCLSRSLKTLHCTCVYRLAVADHNVGVQNLRRFCFRQINRMTERDTPCRRGSARRGRWPVWHAAARAAAARRWTLRPAAPCWHQSLWRCRHAQLWRSAAASCPGRIALRRRATASPAVAAERRAEHCGASGL